MRNLRTFASRVVVLTLALWLLVVPAASAYVDPGSGAFIFQALIAFTMAAGLTVKTFWRRLRALFVRRPAPPVAAGEHDPT
ncbi:MAG TPA: hypothetical protein VHF25_16960 [Nitriliruptorales bacterium]|nr:hypothetical protein [Nitriliruptorales bacterium]